MLDIYQFIHETINYGFHTHSLKTSEIQSWSSEIMASLLCISCHVRIGWGPFGVRETYFHFFTYAFLSH